MAEINRIKSFKTFSEVVAQEAAVKEAEANAAKRSELSAKISALLDEMNITSFDDLDEEVKREFITKAFGQISEEEAGLPAEELEDETKDVTEPTVDADGSEVKSEVEDVEKDLELDGEGEAEGEEIAEGNAFIFAAAKARQDGKDEFEFNGKKYKVTLKKDTGLKESVMIITEGTRGQFGKIYKTGEIRSVYTHYDSYPENMLPTIEKGYKKGKDVDAVISKGDNSGLEVSPDKMNFYGGPNDLNPMKGSVKNLKKYINDADAQGAEYIYLFDERDQKWYMVDVYGDRNLVPAFESVLFEATVEMDAMDPDDKDFLKFLKKHKVTIIDKKMDGPGGGHPVITMQGKRKDLEAVLADEEFGWADPDLAEYIEESVVNEAEIKSDDEFKEYAFAVLQKAFGADFDEAKGQEIVDGILGKVDGDYGAAVGMLTSSLGESVEVNERFKGKDLKEPALGYIYNKKGTQVQVVNMVDKAIMMSYPTPKDAIDKEFDGQIGVDLVDRFKDRFDVKEVEVGGIYDVKESVEVTEKKADGTISDDEDERREDLMSKVEVSIDDLLAMIKKEANDIGGNFRSPGIMYDAKKIIEDKLKKFK